MHTLASKLTHMRETRELSMAALSRLSGVSVATISTIESGKVPNPRRDTLERLAKALSIDVNYFTDEGARTVMEMMGDKLPADMIEFVLAEDSMPYLILAKEAWEATEMSEAAFRVVLELLQRARKGELD